MLEHGVVFPDLVAILIGHQIVVVDAPTFGSKVGMPPHGDGWRHDVSDHLNFVAQKFHRFPESIDFRVESHGDVEVEEVVESVGGVLDFA